MSEPRIVKRYANRKLYDTQRSHYVTLDQIAEMIRTGEEVRVLDNNSKEDLTSVTLAQIIFEEEKRQRSFLPLGAMRHIIQSGGASLSELAQQAQARMRSVFGKGEDEKAEGDKAEGDLASAQGHEDKTAIAPAPAPSLGLALGKTAEEPDLRKEEATSHNAVREFLDRSQQTLDEWQRRVDDRFRHLIEAISPFAALEKEVTRLRERIESLENRLEDHPTEKPR